MQTKDLKVYQDTVEFCKVLHRLTRNFPRFEKYSIGGKLFNDSLDPTWYEYFYIVGDCDKLKLKARYTPKAKLRNILNFLTSNINKHGKNNDSKDRLCAMRQSRREHLQTDVQS